VTTLLDFDDIAPFDSNSGADPHESDANPQFCRALSLYCKFSISVSGRH